VGSVGPLLKDIFGIPHTHAHYQILTNGETTIRIPDGQVEDEDPYGSIASYRVQPVNTNIGVAPGYQTTSVGTGADAHINAARIINFNGDNQRLSFGAYFDYFRDQTNFDASTALFGTSIKQNSYQIGATLNYIIGDYHVDGKLGAVFGDGVLNYSFDGSRAQFNNSGYEGAIAVGRVFTLADHRIFSPLAPGQKSPPIASDGYITGLDITGQIATYNEWTAAFGDTAGFQRGPEAYTTWALGVNAHLFARIYNNGYTWTPFLAVGYSDLFVHEDRLTIVPQAAVPMGANVYLGSPGRNYASVQSGLNIRSPQGINVGVNAFFSGSSATTGYGGRAYIVFPIMRWLGAS
jgi:hypothetical protein